MTQRLRDGLPACAAVEQRDSAPAAEAEGAKPCNLRPPRISTQLHQAMNHDFCIPAARSEAALRRTYSHLLHCRWESSALAARTRGAGRLGRAFAVSPQTPSNRFF